ncbi:MAG: hypothetical protein M3350_03025, partial [Actinomycetota bacterium]|nr:hypothetical protein [Actinomycetota bacterium]
DEVDSAEEAAPADESGEPADEHTRLTATPALEEAEPLVHFDGPAEDPPGARTLQDEPFGVGEPEEEIEPVASLDLDQPLRDAPPGEPVTELHSPFAEPLEEEPPAEELPPEELPPEELPPEELPAQELPAEEFAPEELPPEELPPEGFAPEEPPPEGRALTALAAEELPQEDGSPPLDAPAPEGAEDDDVLEETPDFLSETPEHDRLWFEQKPPRDFDFD